jgi:DNA-binding NarL/FixJ family response regulator
MLSMYGTTTLVRAAFAAGARGFVSKTSAGPEIIAAVEALRRGRHYIDASLEIQVGQTLAVSGLTVATDRYARLSPREQQVFFLLAQGYKPRQIAQKLGIAKRTADAHRYHIIQKLEVESIAGLVRLAAELGVVEPSAPR